MFTVDLISFRAFSLGRVGAFLKLACEIESYTGNLGDFYGFWVFIGVLVWSLVEVLPKED